MDGRTLVAVVLAGIGAALIDNLAAALFFGADFLSLTLDRPGRFVVAIGGAMLIPPVLSVIGGATGYVVAFLALAGGAATLAKMVFGYAAPWTTVLTLTAIYAVAAIAVFVALTGRRAAD